MTHLQRRTVTWLLIVCPLLASTSSAQEDQDPSPTPGGPVYKRPINPEVNPWQDRGIASKYRFGGYYTRKNVDEKWHHDSRTEWQESMAIMGPEQRPEDVIDTKPALTLATSDGTIRQYSWIGAPPEQVDYADAIVHIVNMKARFDPYTIQRIRAGDIYSAAAAPGIRPFPAWNHWPVAQITSDGRHATFPDNAAHSSLTHIFWDDSTPFGEQGLFQEKLLLEGMSDKPAEELLPLARSWLQPATARSLTGGLDVAYDPAQRAYVLTARTARSSNSTSHWPPRRSRQSSIQPLLWPIGAKTKRRRS